MESFITKLFNEIVNNLKNDYSDNYDIERFGKEPHVKKNIKTRIFAIIKKKKRVVDDEQILRFNSIDKYYERMAEVYKLLEDDYSKSLYIKLIAYRILGHRKVKLPLNTLEYKNRIALSDDFKVSNEFIKAPFIGGKTTKLYKFDLSKKNIPLNIYTTDVYSLLFVNQYENDYVKIDNGDILLDCGGCWGDTALIFADKVGDSGHVFSFEFIPENIIIFNQNLALNLSLSNRLTIIQNALSDASGKTLSFSNNGPGSSVIYQDKQSIDVKSITIDDFVAKNNLSKVDYIKMDIEGSELPSLRGAENVLKKYKPKLAISIYHSLDDFVDIPIFINSLNLGYRFFIKHGTIHNEETVLLAISK